MTSYIIDTHKARKMAGDWKPDATFCAFCRIIQDGAKAYKVYENDSVIAILGKSDPRTFLNAWLLII
jgi:hypothetical protein